MREIVEILEKVDWKANDPIAFIGFPSPGLVGSIAVSHIIEELKMIHVGSIHTNLLPPVSLFYGGVLKHPMRIYGTKDGKYISVISEIAISSKALFTITRKLVDWLIRKGCRRVVCLDSFEDETRESVVYGVAEEDALLELEKKDVVRFSRGYVSGLTGCIMNECIVRDEIYGFSLLTPTRGDLPDPKAASYLIDAINRIFGLNISNEKLLEEASKLERELKELAEKVKRARDHEKRSAKNMYFT
ncbi:MAG: proteasome assembly chaperone family protein [Candidatus Odinarchaeota archaeon]|nr:proteasome assembly chaperone family protein [Candidatus Odinarchaeota archaeon]